jgi:hypothetical protein
MNDIGTVRGSLRWRRHLRLSVRTLVILVLVIGGWVGWTVRNAQQQRAAVDAIRSSAGWVRYDWDYRPSGVPPTESMMWPKWLEDFLGPDYLHDVTRVTTGNHDGLAGFAGPVSLQRLDPHGTSITDSGLAHLKVLKNLRHLALDNTSVEGAGLTQLADLHKLDILSLDGTQISDAALVHLKSLTNLKELHLDRTQVSNADLVHLETLPSLKKLWIQQTKVSKAGAAELKKTLPGATIIY